MEKKDTIKQRNLLRRKAEPGHWKGEVIGISSVYFGQEVQDGPPRQSVEFSYVILSAALKHHDADEIWPATIAVVAPTPLKPEVQDAGFFHQTANFPLLNLELNVTRPQFSDLVRSFENGIPKNLHFTVEKKADGLWPIRSWGITASTGVRPRQ
ncbi:hypothetical protein V1T76_15440 [Roseibium sp. FZY0029]|uniref:hypothetical protein n=1 Tax=Roseibium sp. FZY0029 TaxID=3116647 RepID=UPI002EBD3D4A|nr:hypothetical protein [Roseibium sp. FZY0029]